MQVFMQHTQRTQHDDVLYWVTIEAEAGMTICGQCCWGQVTSAHCTAPLMCARYIFVWMMCCTVNTFKHRLDKFWLNQEVIW